MQRPGEEADKYTLRRLYLYIKQHWKLVCLMFVIVVLVKFMSRIQYIISFLDDATSWRGSGQVHSQTTLLIYQSTLETCLFDVRDCRPS